MATFKLPDNIDEFEAAITLCDKAGIDPDEEITRFTMQDVAVALIREADGYEFSEEDIIERLKVVVPSTAADAICNQDWGEALVIYADMEYDWQQHDAKRRPQQPSKGEGR